MKRILFAFGIVVAFVVAERAQAAPFLEADTYPATGPQPSSVSFTVNGGPAIPCTLVVMAAGALKPRCDLVSIATPGTYTLVMSATSIGGCVNAANAATCSAAGVAPSAPFALTWSASAATAPGGLRAVP